MNKWFKIFTVLIVLAVFWTFYFVIQFIYGTPLNRNQKNIPTNAHTVIAINGDLVIKSVLNDFILAEDENLLGKLTESKSDLNESSGINILSDFIFFTINQDRTEVSGVLFNLNSQRKFKSKFEGSITSSNSSVGVLILSEVQGNRIKLQQLANSILRQDNELYSQQLASIRKKESSISIWTRESTSKKWQYASLIIRGSKIKIDGNVIMSQSFSPSLIRIKPDDISFHATINGVVPKSISDSIVAFLKLEGNQIVGFSANYRSLKIDQEKSFEVIPDGDFIFQFAKSIDVNTLLTKGLEDSIITEMTSKKFKFGKQTFYFEQLSENAFYLGRSPKNEIKTETNSPILSFLGNPAYLSKIEGSPLMLRLINIFPVYRMGAGLTKSIESVEMEIKNTASDVTNLKGEIVFRNGKYASIELIQNLLELR